MRTIFALAAAGLIVAASVPALASDDHNCRGAAQGKPMSIGEVAARVTAMGYDVREVERDDGCFEVTAVDTNGARVKLKLSPVSGDVVRRDYRS